MVVTCFTVDWCYRALLCASEAMFASTSLLHCVLRPHLKIVFAAQSLLVYAGVNWVKQQLHAAFNRWGSLIFCLGDKQQQWSNAGISAMQESISMKCWHQDVVFYRKTDFIETFSTGCLNFGKMDIEIIIIVLSLLGNVLCQEDTRYHANIGDVPLLQFSFYLIFYRLFFKKLIFCYHTSTKFVSQCNLLPIRQGPYPMDTWCYMKNVCIAYD